MNNSFCIIESLANIKNKNQFLYIIGWLFAFWRWDIVNIVSQVIHINATIVMLAFFVCLLTFELYAFKKNIVLNIKNGFIMMLFMILCYVQSILIHFNANGMNLFIDFSIYVVLIVIFVMQIDDMVKATDYFCYSCVIALILFAPWPFTKSISYYNDIAYYGTGMVYGERVIVPCFIGIYTLYKRKKSVVFLILSLVTFALGVAAANRGALLTCVCYFFLYNILITPNNYKKMILLFSIALGIALFITSFENIIILIKNVLNEFGINSYAVNKLIMLSSDTTNVSRFSSGRDKTYLKAIELLKEHPFIGIGFGTFAEIGEDAFVHNIILDWFTTLGIVIGIVFSVITVCAVIKLLLIKDREVKIFYLILFSLWFPKLLFSKTFADDAGYWMFMVCMLSYKRNTHNLKLKLIK